MERPAAGFALAMAMGLLLLSACGAPAEPDSPTVTTAPTKTPTTVQPTEPQPTPEVEATAVSPTSVTDEDPTGVAPNPTDDASTSTAESWELGEIHHEIMPTRNHLTEGTPVEYSSVPPTSGDHWPQWSRCGFFQQELPDERLVHNLEHGNIVVSYHFSERGGVERLQVVTEDIPLFEGWGVARAYQSIPVGTVALTAWGVSDRMEGVQADRIRSFFDRYAGKLAPERIRCDESGVMP